RGAGRGQRPPPKGRHDQLYRTTPPMVQSLGESCPVQLKLAAVSERGRAVSERARTGRRGGQGTLSAPGALSSEDEEPTGRQGLLPDEPLPELAARYGLAPSAARPSPLAYLKHLWQRRHFVVAFATAPD